MKNYQARYTSSKTLLRVSVAASVLLTLVVLFAPLTTDYLVLAKALLAVAVGGILVAISHYHEMHLYEDRLEVVSFFGRRLDQVVYSDIRSMGFMNAHSDFISTYGEPPGMVSGSVAELILILHSGERYEYSEDEYAEIGDIGHFIRQRTTL